MLIPRPYQETAIRKGIETNFLLADDCGLGKTFTAIEVARAIELAHPHPVIIICRKSARLQWVNEILKHEPEADAMILDRHQDIEDLGVTSHDSSVWIVTHFEALRKIKRNSPILRIYWRLIVVDEAHRIKNRAAQRTHAVKRLQGYRKMALTGTPMEKHPGDLWSILHFLERRRIIPYRSFFKLYVETEVGFSGYPEVVGVRNPERLARYLNNIYLRRTKAEVAADLPPLIEQRIPIEMPVKLRRAYRKLRDSKDLLVQIEETTLLVNNAMSLIMKLRRLISSGLASVQSAKFEWALDFIEDNPDLNVIIFTTFRATAELVARELDCPCAIGGNPVDLSAKPKIVVGTVQVLGESHDMPWMDVAIFIDSDWSTTNMHQAKNRFHRINITSAKHAYYLYHPGTVDELVFEALDNKLSRIAIVEKFTGPGY